MVSCGWIVSTLQFLFFLTTPVPLLSQKDCRWHGKGDPRDDESISLVRLNCREGLINWKTPHGGKRFLITPRGVQEEFKVCFTSHDKGVNIYTETASKLILLVDYRQISLEPVCFDSAGKHAIIYIENEVNNNRAAQLKFKIYAKGKHSLPKYSEECKPCSSDQIIESIRTGDFVVQGYIKNYATLSDGIVAQANITAKKVIFQREKIFVKEKSTDRRALGSVKIPSTCSWLSRNAHTHIFIGLIIPGRGPVLACRIKQRTWFYYGKYLPKINIKL